MGDYPLNSENSENSQFNVEETQNPEQARSLQSLKVALECIERVTTSPHDSKAGFEPFRINDIKNLLSGEAYDEATKVYLSDALQFARLFEQDIENKNYALVQPRWGHYVHQTGIYYLDGHNDRILGEGYDGLGKSMAKLHAVFKESDYRYENAINLYKKIGLMDKATELQQKLESNSKIADEDLSDEDLLKAEEMYIDAAVAFLKKFQEFPVLTPPERSQYLEHIKAEINNKIGELSNS